MWDGPEIVWCGQLGCRVELTRTAKLWAFLEELTLEEDMDLSQDRLLNE